MTATLKRKPSDVYFNLEYGKTYEQAEDGICQKFSFCGVAGSAENIFIKRKVPYLINDEQYFDAVTPYGYGGPIITELKGEISDFTEEYWIAYKDYCAKEKIVCEFVRFHPLTDNGVIWQGKYQVSHNRKTIAINTADNEFFSTQLTPECRNMVRKANKKGVVLSIDEGFETLDKFIEIYYTTMRKDNASDYYFFEKKYFEDLKKALGEDVFIVNASVNGQIISSAIFMKSENFIHYHLSANDPEFYSFAANNAILNLAAEYANRNNISWFHLGGGLSGSSDDRLFKFKRSFGRRDENLKDFYIGKSIFNEEVYALLCEQARQNNSFNEGFFPQYR